MTTLKETVKSIDCIFSDAARQEIEADVLLPDYYPEVSRILNCDVSYSEESVTVSGDRISVCGQAHIRLLFSSEDGALSSFETVTKYTKLIVCCETRQDDACFVSQTPGDLHYRALAPRRIEVRAAAAVHVRLYRLLSHESVTSADDDTLQCRTVEVNVFRPEALCACGFRTSGETQLPCAREDLAAVFGENARLTVSGTNVIRNKLMLKGEVEVSFACICKDGTLYPDETRRFPFSEILDVYGITDASAAYVCADEVSVSFDLKSGASDAAGCTVTADAKVRLLAGSDGVLTAFDDAYSLKGEVKCARSAMCLPSFARRYENRQTFTFEAQCYDENVSDVCLCTANVAALGFEREGGAAVVSPALRVNALMKGNDGGYFFFSRTTDLRFEDPTLPEGAVPFLGAYCTDLSAGLQPDGKLRFTVTLQTAGFYYVQTDLRLVTEIEEGEETQTETEPSLILYYADPDEEVWDIAKRNRTSVGALENGTAEGDAGRRFVFFSS
ncbi:MAG: DUF3794 domain-containing protein [Clostridia bacterium]|nr:DUF3794 domain-containing protein [Clostridia bacterium]